jgi:SnoaL-like domain
MAGRSFDHLTPCWASAAIEQMNEEGRQMAKTAMASETIESKNKALVLEAFDTLFNKRDYAAAERFWSPNYIQHSAHIAPGREGLFNLVRSVPVTMRYENQLIVAEGDYVNSAWPLHGDGKARRLDRSRRHPVRRRRS